MVARRSLVRKPPPQLLERRCTLIPARDEVPAAGEPHPCTGLSHHVDTVDPDTGGPEEPDVVRLLRGLNQLMGHRNVRTLHSQPRQSLGGGLPVRAVLEGEQRDVHDRDGKP